MYPKGNLFIPASHGQLEAILKEPSGEPKGVALVCHPHPLGGGTMHNKVVFRAAAGLVDAGLITLRFNFRGVGASDGEHDGEAEKQDVRDALDYLAENYPNQEITLAGFSFGTRIGSEVGMTDARVVRLISIGTPVDKYDFQTTQLIRKHLQKDANCIDIGANLGHILMEIVAAAPKGKHFAFEPIPDLYTSLKKKFGKNRFRAQPAA